MMDVEKLLALPDGRTLAYEHTGPPTSPSVVIFLTGTLSVGMASPFHRPPALASVHYIAPTLPGYGNTSPPSKGVTYAATIAGDMCALLNDLYPDQGPVDLYIAGGSFGTVAAQMLYGAPFDIFPQGRNIRKMLLLSGFPPISDSGDPDFIYTRWMTWLNYITVGPPAKYIPFRIIPRLMKRVAKSKLKTQEAAEAFNQRFLFGMMDAAERELYTKWKEEKGYDDGQLWREIAQMNRRSVAKSWEGLMSTAEVVHSEWWGGKKLAELDDEHTKERKVLVVAGDKDNATPPQWSEYMASKYTNARLKMIEGGHLSTIFHADDIWVEFMNM